MKQQSKSINVKLIYFWDNKHKEVVTEAAEGNRAILQLYDNLIRSGRLVGPFSTRELAERIRI